MRLLFLLLFLPLVISCSAGKKTSSSSIEQDTTYEKHTELIKAIDLPGVAPELGMSREINTPVLKIKLDRISEELVVVTSHKPVIRQKVTETQFVPTRIKDKSHIEIHQGSHNTDKSKDKSKDKRKQDSDNKDKSKENSDNRHKEKGGDWPLWWLIMAIVGTAYYLIRKFKIKIPFIS